MFNVQDPHAPLQLLPPELLAQIAQGAFRPPQLPQAPQMQVPQQQGDGGMGAGLAGLGMGLGAFRGLGNGTIVNAQPTTTGPAFGAGNSSWFDANFTIDPATGTLVPRR